METERNRDRQTHTHTHTQRERDWVGPGIGFRNKPQAHLHDTPPRSLHKGRGLRKMRKEKNKVIKF